MELRNRIALAPMTRVSAAADGVPADRIGAYYRVFADGGFGLLITEGLYVDDKTSQGYFFQPGIANPPDHAAAWARVVDGVHGAGSKFFAQLMHAGSQSQGNPHTTTTWGTLSRETQRRAAGDVPRVRPVSDSQSDDR